MRMNVAADGGYVQVCVSLCEFGHEHADLYMEDEYADMWSDGELFEDVFSRTPLIIQ
jgi:Na+-transporting NADH:ubiquinone oxidoreductase subunit NqrF